MDLKIPRGIGVKEITGQRIRAEVTDILVGFYSGDGLPIADNHSSWVIDQGRPPVEYEIRNLGAFEARDSEFRIWLSGTWRWGPAPGQAMAKVTTAYNTDLATVAFYTGKDDPWPDTIVTVFFTKDISEHQVPYLERYLVPPK